MIFTTLHHAASAIDLAHFLLIYSAMSDPVTIPTANGTQNEKETPTLNDAFAAFQPINRFS
jgi:hypothetical protein